MTARRVNGIDRRELLLLTAHVVHKDRSWTIAHPEHRLTASQKRRLRALVLRRRAGEPIAYLTGEMEFYGHPFQVGNGILVPRPESELLVDEALRLCPPSTHGAIADIGTGSGCLAISIALARPSLRVYATDSSPIALSYARRNARRLLDPHRIEFFRGDLLAPLLSRGIEPICIVANLPYATPKEYRNVHAEPRAAIVGGHDGMLVYRRFFAQLKQSGLQVPVVIEIDPRRLSSVKKLARSAYPRCAISMQKDLAGFPRMLTIIPLGHH